jgi:hypothetical protein
MGKSVMEYTLISFMHILHTPDTSSRISPWVIALRDLFPPTRLDHHRHSPGAPVLASVSKGVPGIFMDCHMMVAHPEKVQCVPLSLLKSAY